MRIRSATMALLLAAAPAIAGELRVMTYNVLHGQPCSGGSRGEEVDARMALAVAGTGAAPGLAALEPDVVGMQEVSQVFVSQPAGQNQACAFTGTPEGVDTVAAYEHQGDQIVRRLNGAVAGSPYKMRFVRDNPRIVPLLPDVPLPPDEKSLSDHAAELGNVEIGLAVVSKQRIQQVTVHNLTIGEVPGETRAILHATIRDGAGKPYDFYDSHLTTTGGDSPQTVVMAAEIARFILTTRRHPESPGFFTCDCNATEDSATHQLFTAAGFVDTFRLANPSDPGFTSGRDNLERNCDQETRGRIDYVWALPDSKGAIPKVVSSEVVMDFFTTDGTSCLWPSDHNGVLTVFDPDDLVTP